MQVTREESRVLDLDARASRCTSGPGRAAHAAPVPALTRSREPTDPDEAGWRPLAAILRGMDGRRPSAPAAASSHATVVLALVLIGWSSACTWCCGRRHRRPHRPRSRRRPTWRRPGRSSERRPRSASSLAPSRGRLDRGQAGERRPPAVPSRPAARSARRRRGFTPEDTGRQDRVARIARTARWRCSSSSPPGARTARPRPRTWRRLRARFAGTSVQFVSINADSENAASVYAYHRYFGLPFPALLDPGPQSGRASTNGGGLGPGVAGLPRGYYPTFYVLDRIGVIRWRDDVEQPDATLRGRRRSRVQAESAVADRVGLRLNPLRRRRHDREWLHGEDQATHRRVRRRAGQALGQSASWWDDDYACERRSGRRR